MSSENSAAQLDRLLAKKGVKMGGNLQLNFEWPFPNLNERQKLWRMKSRFTLFMVGMTSRIFLSKLRNIKTTK